MSNNLKKTDHKQIDWMITLVPFALIMGLAVFLFIFPEQSNAVIGQVRFFFGDTMGFYYLVIGLAVLIISVWLSFSKYGDIVLGEPNEKPKYSWIVSRTLVSTIKSKAGEYDVIISSYPSIWPFIVCSKLKSKNPKIKWICDFRDICGRHTSSFLNYGIWHINYVKKHSALADAVFHVDDFIDTHTDKRVKDYTVTNGYDPEEAVVPENPAMFNLIYTGTIYGNLQSVEAVYKAINEGNGQLAQLMAEAHGGAEYFTNLDVIPRYKVLELQSKAAILIQAAFNVEGDHCAWTGKMYEYMMSQKPIVYVVNGNIPHSFPSKNMERLGGVCYEASRHEETYPILKEYIYTKYREWEETGNVSIVQDKDYVGKYSYKVIAEQVWEILNSL